MSGWGIVEAIAAGIVFATAVFLVVVAYDFGNDFARFDKMAARKEARERAKATPATDRARHPKANVASPVRADPVRRS